LEGIAGMEASTAAVSKGASDFMSWWYGELSSVVPVKLRQAFKPVERTIAVTMDDNRISLTKIEGGETETIVQLGLKSASFETSKQELGRLVAKYPARRWRWGLYLDGGSVLQDRLMLPIAAKENYFEAVEFQIDRQTPFQRNEIYFDCYSNNAGSTSRMLCVDYIIAPLEKVDATVQDLATIGIPVDFVTTLSELSGEQPRFNLLSSNNTPKRQGGRRINVMLAMLAILLGGAVTYLSLDNDRRHAELLAAHVDSLRNQARLAAELRSTVASEQRNVNYVLNLKRDQQSVIKILNDLTRLLPDDSWVSRFTFKNDKVQIVVHAPESSSIVRLVEGSGQFAGAKMMTAVRKTKNDDRERFTLSFSSRLGTKP
jgi:general secretion pathway protein L